MHFQSNVLFSSLIALLILLIVNLSVATGETDVDIRLSRSNVIEHNGNRFVLFGVVVPTSTMKCAAGDKVWPCGATATLRLYELLQQDAVSCSILNTDQPQQFARCTLDNLDIASQLVLEGWALTASGVSVYRAEERSARELSTGVWKANFTPPESWRRYPEQQVDLVEELLCSTCAVRRQ